MSTYKTLADAQPGGRVRLGDQAELDRLEFQAWAEQLKHTLTRWGNGPGDVTPLFVSEVAGNYISPATQAAWEAWRHLSTQPSPGGQDALAALQQDYDKLLDSFNRQVEVAEKIAGRALQQDDRIEELEEALAARQPVGQEPVCNGGFVISNGSGEKYMAWGQVGPEWTADRSAALWLVRRADAEALAAENEDAWSILPVERCALPPNGWACTLASGHEGPCPTIAAPPAQAVDLGQTFQAGVAEWMGQCFLPSLYCNMTERGDRLLEEVLELLQAHGYDKARVPTLVDYVFSRPVGDPAQEVGGVMVTLAGYCWVAGLDMHVHGHAELARISHPEVMARIRAKQEAKNALHFDTPLPGNAAAPAPAQAVPLGRWSQWHADDLHVAVHTALSVHAGSLSQKKRAAISAYVKRLLIDSQAVGK
ncbi:TPA: hypothetical protein QEK28_000283 [Stenotrophomonas maltophilia]|nr:hypothetical protein [Stenotrophomonas maltophilia]